MSQTFKTLVNCNLYINYSNGEYLAWFYEHLIWLCALFHVSTENCFNRFLFSVSSFLFCSSCAHFQCIFNGSFHFTEILLGSNDVAICYMCTVHTHTKNVSKLLRGNDVDTHESVWMKQVSRPFNVKNINWKCSKRTLFSFLDFR